MTPPAPRPFAVYVPETTAREPWASDAEGTRSALAPNLRFG